MADGVQMSRNKLRQDAFIINPVGEKFSEADRTQGLKILELMPDRSVPSDAVVQQRVQDQLVGNVFGHSGELNEDVSDFFMLASQII